MGEQEDEVIVSFTMDSPSLLEPRLPVLFDAVPSDLRIDTGRRVITCQVVVGGAALFDYGTVTVGETVFTIVSDPVSVRKPWYSVAGFVLRRWWSRALRSR